MMWMAKNTLDHPEQCAGLKSKSAIEEFHDCLHDISKRGAQRRALQDLSSVTHAMFKLLLTREEEAH